MGIDWTYISKWIHSQTSEQPLIISGPPSTLWEEILITLQCTTVCTQLNKEGVGCRTCLACSQTLRQLHPDTIVISNEDATIRIKEVRALKELLQRHAIGDKRLVIIPRAERLTLESSNALLKELEETSRSTRFVLTTSYPSRIIATIRSRSQMMQLNSEQAASLLSQEDLNTALTNIAYLGRKDRLTKEELDQLSHILQSYIHYNGADSRTIRALMRLRDYYKITSRRGNEKLAGEVLLASLTQLRNTSAQKTIVNY